MSELNCRLDFIADAARLANRNCYVGWILLARGLINSVPTHANYHLAAKSLVQCRRAFLRQYGVIPPPASMLYHRAIEMMDQDRSRFHDIQDTLSKEDTSPPDFPPWPSRWGELPARVRSKKDGKIMRLVLRGAYKATSTGGRSGVIPFTLTRSRFRPRSMGLTSHSKERGSRYRLILLIASLVCPLRKLKVMRSGPEKFCRLPMNGMPLNGNTPLAMCQRLGRLADSSPPDAGADQDSDLW